MSRAHSITMPCTCVNNTSCNLPKVVQEPEIPAPRGKEWQSGVVIADCCRQVNITGRLGDKLVRLTFGVALPEYIGEND